MWNRHLAAIFLGAGCMAMAACGTGSPVGSPPSKPAAAPLGATRKGVDLVSTISVDGGLLRIAPVQGASPGMSAAKARVRFDQAFNPGVTHPTLLLGKVTIASRLGPALPQYHGQMAWVALVVGQPVLVGSCGGLPPSPTATPSASATPPPGDPPVDPSLIQIYVMSASDGAGVVLYTGPSVSSCTGNYVAPALTAATEEVLVPWVSVTTPGGSHEIRFTVPACGSISTFEDIQVAGKVMVSTTVNMAESHCSPPYVATIPISGAGQQHGPTGPVLNRSDSATSTLSGNFWTD